MRRALLAAAIIASIAEAVSAQRRLPVIIPLGRAQPQQPALVGIEALRADFLARSGTDTVYFGMNMDETGKKTEKTAKKKR